MQACRARANPSEVILHVEDVIDLQASCNSVSSVFPENLAHLDIPHPIPRQEPFMLGHTPSFALIAAIKNAFIVVPPTIILHPIIASCCAVANPAISAAIKIARNTNGGFTPIVTSVKNELERAYKREMLVVASPF